MHITNKLATLQDWQTTYPCCINLSRQATLAGTLLLGALLRTHLGHKRRQARQEVEREARVEPHGPRRGVRDPDAQHGRAACRPRLIVACRVTAKDARVETHILHLSIGHAASCHSTIPHLSHQWKRNNGFATARSHIATMLHIGMKISPISDRAC